MTKTQISLDYLKEVEKIKEFLRFTTKSEKSLKTYFLAFDKFFPFLVDFFEVVEKFNLTEHLEKKVNEINEVKTEWSNTGVVDKVFEEWSNLDKEKRSNLFMKWVNSKDEDIRNTYLNYVWRAQGFLKKVHKKWKANPDTIDKLVSNGLHLDDSENITLSDVGELYNKLSDKYKLILKMMLYTGLNPADLVTLKPTDFKRISDEEKYRDNIYFYVNKIREKSKHKNVNFLQVYTESFMNEIIDYFETKKTLKYNKVKQSKQVEKLRKDDRFVVVKEYKNFIEFSGNKDWEKDKKEFIFGGIKSTSISGAFSYQNGDKIARKVLPSTVRRLCFSRLAPLFNNTQIESDIYNLWSQHSAGIMGNHYMTTLIETIILRLEKNDIQKAVLLGNMGDYIKKNNTLIKKIKEIENMKKEMESMKQLHKEEMSNLRDEVRTMFEDFKYKKDLDDRVKKGEITSDEARVEYQGIELTEEEKHSKLVKKTK